MKNKKEIGNKTTCKSNWRAASVVRYKILGHS